MAKIYSHKELIEKSKSTFERFGAKVVYATPDGNIFLDKQRAQEYDRNNIIEITAEDASTGETASKATGKTASKAEVLVGLKKDILQGEVNPVPTDVETEETPAPSKKKATTPKKK